jgi:hypothetical protein
VEQASGSTIKVGNDAPNITVTDLNGRTVVTGDVKDELLIFSAASRWVKHYWCTLNIFGDLKHALLIA